MKADSPPNLVADIPWAAGLNGVFDTEAAYNAARRQEEIQLGLTANALGDLNLPAQAVWDTYSDDQKAEVILNAERLARISMTPGVIGLPFTAIQVDVDNLAQTHADYLVSANTTGHIDGAGNSPFDRIDNDLVLGPCHEFLSRAENIASFWNGGTSNPLYIERAIYNWVYDDSGSAWGHREAVLIQDKDLENQSLLYGFNNNVGSLADEGYIGIGVAESAGYNPYGWNWVNMGTVVVLNMIDPISTGSCPWDVAPTPIPPTPTNTVTPTPIPPTPTNTVTPTPIPPTPTNTVTPTPILPTPTNTETPTPVPPTPTNMPAPPTPTPTDTVGGATTKSLKEDARYALAELLPTGNARDNRHINRAVMYVDRSLASRYWVDDEHLTYRGTWVFYFEKMAVRYLTRVSSVEAPVDEVISTLVHVDKTLAQTALDDAQAAGGHPDWIARAEREMERALYDLSRERPAKAIDHYKRAWGYSILSQWLSSASAEAESGMDSTEEFRRLLEADEFLYLPVIQ